MNSLINFEGIQLPFSPGNLLNSGLELFDKVDMFLLLALAFIVVRMLIRLVSRSFNPSDGGVKRDEHGNRIHFQSRAAKAEFEAFKKEKGWK